MVQTNGAGAPKKQPQGEPFTNDQLEIFYAFTEFEEAVKQILSLFAC